MTDVPGREAKRCSPAALRNRDPILEVLRDVLPARGRVLEVASGSGQHVVHFARALPSLTFQPSDVDPAALASIAAHLAEAELTNVAPPIQLDVTSEDWPVERADALLCINMIHIAPWAACQGLLRGAARVLPPAAVVVLYGPFRFDGAFQAPSNAAFDRSLRAQNSSWGVRDLTDVTSTAAAAGLERDLVIARPANNHVVVFRKRAKSPDVSAR